MYQYPYGNAQQLNLDWILSKLQELESGSGGGADLEEVANALVSASFDATIPYRKYDYAFYDGKLYRALNDNIGVFNPADWMEVTLGADIPVLTRLVNADSALITTLQNQLQNLGSDEVANESTVTGNTVSDALGTLNGAITSAEKSIGSVSASDGIDYQQIVNYYINATNGVLNNPTSGSGWRYIKAPAKAGDVFVISTRGVTNPSGYYFADSSNNVLEQEETQTLLEDYVVIAPNNSAWIVLNTNSAWLKNLSCRRFTKTIIVDANGGGDYTSLTEALYNTSCNVVVRAGTYDIVAEYKALFGDSIFSNISDSYTTIGMFRYGLFIDNRKVKFETGTQVNCNLTNVLSVDGSHRFCPFNLGSNAVIDGLKCYAVGSFYLIHDDFGETDAYYTNIIENCILYGTIYNANIIGGGTRNHSTSIVKNCRLDNGNNATETMRYHNYNSASAAPTVIVENCYANGTIGARYYGSQSSPHMKFIAINNVAKDIKKLAESASFNVDNVDLFVTTCGEPLYTAEATSDGANWSVYRFPNGFAICYVVLSNFTFTANTTSTKTYQLPFTFADVPFILPSVNTIIPDKLEIATSGLTFTTVTLTGVSTFVNDQTPRVTLLAFGRWK